MSHPDLTPERRVLCEINSCFVGEGEINKPKLERILAAYRRAVVAETVEKCAKVAADHERDCPQNLSGCPSDIEQAMLALKEEK